METQRGANFHNSYIRPCLGELVGSFLFGFLGCFSGQPNSFRSLTFPVFSAIALFLARRIVSECSDGIFNPAVTVYLCIRSRVVPMTATAFVVVQFFGFCLAEITFRLLVSSSIYDDYLIGYELIDEPTGEHRISRLQAFLLESALTAILCLAYNEEQNPRNWKADESTIPLTWAAIQLAGFALVGQWCNVSLVAAKAFLAAVFSPINAPPMTLLYLNVFNAILGVFIALLVHGTLSYKENEAPPQEMQPVQFSEVVTKST